MSSSMSMSMLILRRGLWRTLTVVGALLGRTANELLTLDYSGGNPSRGEKTTLLYRGGADGPNEWQSAGWDRSAGKRERPLLLQTRNPFSCLSRSAPLHSSSPQNNPAEDTGDWSACDSNGRKTKILGFQTTPVKANLCQSEAERTVSLACRVDCVVKSRAEDDGPWGFSQSSRVKVKVLGVKAEALNGGSCPTTQERTIAEECPLDCIVESPLERISSWSTCLLVGTRHRTLAVTEKVMDGGSCPSDEERTIHERCAIDCVVNTVDEDTGLWGACTVNGTMKKILRIKSPALNGGSCLSESARTLTTTCAVDCVANTLAEDKGPWGQCHANGFKQKILRVKVEALNSGFCPSEVQRTVQARCPVDCVVRPELEDTGPWGACQADGTKEKVLGIKTQALNSGSCPIDHDRVITTNCAVNCVVNTAMEDDRDWGLCMASGVKLKVLGIKVEVINGGSCSSELERTISQSCGGECVIETPLETTASWGDCQPDGLKHKILAILKPAGEDGPCRPLWKRTISDTCPVACEAQTKADLRDADWSLCQTNGVKLVVLGIKTTAKYGGSCPAAAARTISEPCPLACQVMSETEDNGAWCE